MTSDANNKETWEACPAGTLEAYARKADARRRFRAITRATGAVAAIVCAVGLTMWSLGRFSGEQEYYFGSIACRDVRTNFEAYAMGTLPEKTAEQIKTHLRECPACQELMHQMKQRERSAASLHSAGSTLHSSSPNPEGRFAQLTTMRALSVAQTD